MPDCPNCAKLKAQRDSLAERLRREQEYRAMLHKAIWPIVARMTTWADNHVCGAQMMMDIRQLADLLPSLQMSALTAPPSAPAAEKGSGA